MTPSDAGELEAQPTPSSPNTGPRPEPELAVERPAGPTGEVAPAPTKPTEPNKSGSLKTLGQRVFGSLDESVQRWADTVRYRLVVPALIALLGAAGVFMARHRDQMALILKNQLKKPDRINALVHLGGAVGAVLCIYLAGVVVHRVRRGSWSLSHPASFLDRALAFVMATPFVVALTLPRIEVTQPLMTLFFVAVAAALCFPTFRLLGRWREADTVSDEEPSRLSRGLTAVGRYAAPVAVAAMFVGYGLFYTRMAINNHHALVTRTIDLGYYDNIFYQSIHGRPLACSFMKAGYHGSAHFDPILVVLSPLYLLYPRAELILTLQAVWCGAGVIPCYLLGRRVLDSRPAGVVLALVYMLYPALQGANMYEFHSLTLLATPLLFALYFFEIGAIKRYYAMLPVLLLVREDVPLVLCFVGFYALLSRRPGYARLGWVTILVSVAYFVLVKAVFMPSSDVLNSGKDSYSFEYYFRDMIPGGEGLRGFVVSLLINPVFALKHAVSEAKLEYIGVLMLPLLFLPLVARPGRVMLIYPALFLLLATRKPVFEPHFQYSILAFPAAFAVVPRAIRQLQEGSLVRHHGFTPREVRSAVLGCMLVAALLTSWKFGGFVENDAFRGGFARVIRKLSPVSEENYRRIREMVDRIEPGASVTTTNKLGPQVSNRKEVYLYRQRKHTHYVFLDERELKGGMKAWHQRRVQRGELELLDSMGSYKLYRFHEDKRPKTPQARDEKGGDGDDDESDPEAPPKRPGARVPRPQRPAKPPAGALVPPAPDDDRDPREDEREE